MSVYKSLLAAAVIGLTAPVANASIMSLGLTPSSSAPVVEDIGANETFFDLLVAENTSASESKLYTFTAEEDIIVKGLSFTSNGTLASVSTTSVTFDGVLTSKNIASGSTPDNTLGTLTFGSFTVKDGDSFDFAINAFNTELAVLTAFFETTVIPVPAALPLLGGGLLLLAGVRRRAKTV